MTTPVPVNEANTSFFLALFKKLSEDDNTANIFFSPFSISAALAMVLLGAKCNTADQMSKVLGFTKSTQPASSEAEPLTADGSTRGGPMQSQQQQQPGGLPDYLRQCLNNQTVEEDRIGSKFAELLSDIVKDDAPYDLSLANRLFGDESYEFVEQFLGNTKKYYNAELKLEDFQNNSEQARININGWVEEETQGKITDLLAQGVVDSMTKLVLVNAIYFKGQWAEKFKEEDTFDGQFRINENETRPVKMMQQKANLPLTTIDKINIKILELPYQGEDLSMFIILPRELADKTTSLEKLEKELSFEKFEEWTHPDKMGRTKVEVRLPRFKMEKKYSLKEVLKSMGMVDAFDVSRSDFSGMSTVNDLVLSKVFHKAFVDVNEEGTEATGAAAAAITNRSAAEVFNADHPFLFFIQHKPTKTVLFAGRYCSPE